MLCPICDMARPLSSLTCKIIITKIGCKISHSCKVRCNVLVHADVRNQVAVEMFPTTRWVKGCWVLPQNWTQCEAEWPKVEHN